MNLPTPHSLETLNQLINRYKIIDIIQLAAYFNYVLPVAEKYLSPVQCYMSLIDAQDDESVRLRRGYIPMLGPYIGRHPFQINCIVAYKCFTNKTLIRDYIELYNYITNEDELTEPLDIYYVLAANPSKYELDALNEELKKIGDNLDRIIKLNKCAVTIIQNGSITVDDIPRDCDYCYKLLAQYGYHDMIQELNLGHTHDRMLLIEGCLLGGYFNKAAELLSTGGTINFFSFDIFNYVDCLQFFQQMEQLSLSRDEADTFYYSTLMYCTSLRNNNNVLTENKIFSYTLSKTDFNFDHLAGYWTVSRLLETKSLLDFHGFIQIWERLPAKHKIVNPRRLECSEAKSIVLNLPKF